MLGIGGDTIESSSDSSLPDDESRRLSGDLTAGGGSSACFNVAACVGKTRGRPLLDAELGLMMVGSTRLGCGTIKSFPLQRVSCMTGLGFEAIGGGILLVPVKAA